MEETFIPEAYNYVYSTVCFVLSIGLKRQSYLFQVHLFIGLEGYKEKQSLQTQYTVLVKVLYQDHQKCQPLAKV